MTPSKKLQRILARTLMEFSMIQPGDRILIGVSGGKDSLSLLHCLHHVQRRVPIAFDLAAITIDPLVGGFDPAPLVPYLAALGIPYFVEREDIVGLANAHMRGDSYCAFCARMKRGLLYQAARREGYNVLALGQHLDDLAESFLMSAFHGGKLNTMKAHYRNDAGDVRIIRPFARVRERMLVDFAAQNALPVIKDNCPACFAKPTQREHFKQLLAAEEALNPQLFRSLAVSLTPLMREGLAQALLPAPLPQSA
ncbi:MAG: tRNA 2-thiocytidine(32) synthetase TtcA [Halothiobacillus sp. 24-54-40]|nr:tRNA 2-thiocytidine biosynthesis protein TtcA [Halothiobacillaceae bacterium]OYY32613.1 MAG: tRNA 2-thiocytidine(32) synthetase TtcA [Halothiobacillus sp. 35-54-62]OYZ84846.1 MAG: tRNA 2-thiocytidine(32) synthetase TtcA [Halothiobacillus sp. 24-54-40]OZA79278.1 MAG: tRNA 2-thiocytidine(32) synthetase TtcA [Halothiobacillus sp. 39-53-45]HQS03094.1 tRNA 2-thiocytidine biosynthesis TtcA family protein [Halothiobacillus sp.]